MTITDRVVWQGLKILHTWKAGAALPAGLPVRQVASVCFAETGEVVPVSETGHAWTLPGGIQKRPRRQSRPWPAR